MTLRQCLSKFRNQFKNIPNLGYYIENAIIPYAESGNSDYYKEFKRRTEEDEFILRCLVGFVYCVIKYDKLNYSAIFENTLNNETIYIQNTLDYDAKEIDSKLFDIFD